MNQERSRQEIIEYIRLNRAVYTREAIERQLLDAGYSSEEIEAAWNNVEPLPSRSDIDLEGKPKAWDYAGFIVGWLLLFFVGLGVLFLTNLGLGLGFGGRYSDFLTIINVLFFIVELAILVFGLVGLARGWPPRKASVALLIASVAVYLIMAGTCFATLQVL